MSRPRHPPPAEPDPDVPALFPRADGIPRAVRRQAAFHVFFAQAVFPLLEARREDLLAPYTPGNGRPAWDPVRLPGELILQFLQRVSDRAAAEMTPHDQRWRNGVEGTVSEWVRAHGLRHARHRGLAKVRLRTGSPPHPAAPCPTGPTRR